MFCSNCGKTIDPAQDSCPHCGQRIGASRMSGHTSAQSKYEPLSTDPQTGAKYTPYTRTTYTSNVDVGDDVYSRTTYRPVIVDSNQTDDVDDLKQNAPDKNDTSAQTDVTPPKEDVDLGEVNRESLSRLESVPDDAPDSSEAKAIIEKELDIKVRPVTPIKKTGISPEVEEYIKRVEAMKNRSRKKRAPSSMDETADKPEQDDTSIEDKQDALDEDDLQDEPVEVKKPKKQKKAAPRSKSKVWLSRILVAACIAVLIVGGVVYLAFMTQPKDQIEGVDNELFKAGVQLIKSHTTSEYRTNIMTAFKNDTTGAAAIKLQAEAGDEINKLVPENPKANDLRFIDTLLEIQKSIDAATTTDALAALTKGDISLSTLSSDSAEQWDIINNYVLRLESATLPEDLDIVSRGVANVLATPEPTPTPTPSAYKILKKGDTNSPRVKKMQVRLAELGWFAGNQDGDYGSITQTAVKQFQQASGLEVTGIATPEVQEAIFAENAARTAAKATPAPDDSVGAAADTLE